MNQDDAIHVLTRFSARAVRTAPIPEQLPVYEALSILGRTADERGRATQIFLKLEEVTALEEQLSLRALTGDGAPKKGKL
jgi:hypothetical protein